MPISLAAITLTVLPTLGSLINGFIVDEDIEKWYKVSLFKMHLTTLIE